MGHAAAEGDNAAFLPGGPGEQAREFFVFKRVFKPSLHNHRAQDILGLVHLGFGPEGASSSLLAGEASG